jgi:hypothetical protein
VKTIKWRLLKAALLTKRVTVDLTKLESGKSFLQVKAPMSMKEKLRQVRGSEQ